MRNVRCLAFRIENEAGFDDNEYIRETLRSITEQVGLFRETKVRFYDTENMDLLKKGRLMYCEETEGGPERLLGESRHTWGLVQKVTRPIQVRESVERPYSDSWTSELEPELELARVFTANRTRRAYLVSGCDLVWQKADWKEDGENKHFHELRLSAEPENESVMVNLAGRLSRTLRLQLETGSMEMRALSALSGVERKRCGRKAKVREKEPAGAWLKDLLLMNSTALVEALESFLKKPQDAETLHDMRVALRILRSSLSFGRDLLEEEVYGQADSALRQLGNVSSEARDLQVLMESIHSVGDSGTGQLAQELKSRRDLAYREVYEFIHSGAATALLTDTLSLVLKEGAWKEVAWDQQASEYEADMQDVWMERLIRKSRQFSIEDMRRTHRLRIQVKKLRYVMRNIENHNKENKEVLKVLGKLQDVLGRIHDRSQQTRILMYIFKDVTEPALKFELGYYLGILAEHEQIEREVLEKEAKKLFMRLEKI